MVPASTLVRAMSGRALPDVSDPRVQREIRQIRDGKRRHPILAVGDVVVDGEHRLAAAAHVNPSAPVAVIRTVGNTENRKGTPVSKQKIEKNSVSNGAAAALHHAVAVVRPFVHEPAIEAITSKMLALADDVEQPRDISSGWTQPVVAKAADALADATLAVQKMDRADPGFAEAQQRLRKLQAGYLAIHSPGFVAAEETRRLARGPRGR